MQTGQVADKPFIELICSLAAQKASGRLEVHHEKRRRAFYFEHGKLSDTRSNLKSESAARLKERHPDAADSEVSRRQARLRLRNAVRLTDGDWEFRPNAPPKARAELDLIALVWETLSSDVPLDQVEARLVGHQDKYPRTAESGVRVADLPIGAELREMIRDLDGTRTLDDVLDFAPAEPGEARRALYLALLCGVLSFGEAEQSAEVRATTDEVEHSSIAALIAGAVGGEEMAPEDDGPTLTHDVGDVEMTKLRQELHRVQNAEDVFGVLGVHWDASDEEYRKAYVQLARDLHPDRWQSQGPDHVALAEEILSIVNDAWAKVDEPGKRKVYVDSVIHGIKTEDELAMEKVRAILAAEDRFKAGLVQLNRGAVVKAHELFKEAFEMVPEEAEFRAYYGFTTFKLNWGKDDQRAQNGVTMIKEAIDDHVKLDAGWVLLGLVFRQVGQTRKSFNAFKRALEMNNSNAEAVRELRRARTQLDKEKADKGSESKGLFGRLFGKK